jgi:hypothetical protein
LQCLPQILVRDQAAIYPGFPTQRASSSRRMAIPLLADTAGFSLIGVATISGPGCCWLESTRSRSGGVLSPVR